MEIAINDTVIIDGVTCKCTEFNTANDCRECCFYPRNIDGCNQVGDCHEKYRNDGKNVIYVKV